MATARLQPKPFKNRTHPNLYLLSALAGLIFILSGLYLSYSQTILSFVSPPPPAPVISPQRGMLPVEIAFPRLNITQPIEEAEITHGVWLISPKNASHLATSARPGESGNVVIYGHNKWSIFGPLVKVKPGDRITLTSAEGKTRDYEVKSITTVNPDEVQLVLPTAFEAITVYTCTGFLDSKRLVIRAMPL